MWLLKHQSSETFWTSQCIFIGLLPVATNNSVLCSLLAAVLGAQEVTTTLPNTLLPSPLCCSSPRDTKFGLKAPFSSSTSRSNPSTQNITVISTRWGFLFPPSGPQSNRNNPMNLFFSLCWKRFPMDLTLVWHLINARKYCMTFSIKTTFPSWTILKKSTRTLWSSVL